MMGDTVSENGAYVNGLAPIPTSERSEPGSVNIPLATWPESATLDPGSAADDIVAAINRGLAASHFAAIGELFARDCYWRDHLALSWNLRTVKGRDGVVGFLEKDGAGRRLTKLELDQTSEWRSPRMTSFDGRSGARGLQFYFTFAAKHGSGRGVARLVQEGMVWKVWTLFTSLESILGHEEPRGPRRPNGVQHGANPDRKNWLDRRVEDANFEHGEPDVLILGRST